MWIKGTVAEPPTDGQLAVSTAGSTELIDVSTGPEAFPPLCNPDILVGSTCSHIPFLVEHRIGFMAGSRDAFDVVYSTSLNLSDCCRRRPHESQLPARTSSDTFVGGGLKVDEDF